MRCWQAKGLPYSVRFSMGRPRRGTIDDTARNPMALNERGIHTYPACQMHHVRPIMRQTMSRPTRKNPHSCPTTHIRNLRPRQDIMTTTQVMILAGMTTHHLDKSSPSHLRKVGFTDAPKVFLKVSKEHGFIPQTIWITHSNLKLSIGRIQWYRDWTRNESFSDATIQTQHQQAEPTNRPTTWNPARA